MDWNDYQYRCVELLQEVDRAACIALSEDITAARRTGSTVFTCGNGGSASSASHLAQDLSKGTLIEGVPPLRALCLCDNVSTLTAWANDEGYERVFEEPLRALARPGDLLIAISGSGNSQNVLNAVAQGNAMGVRTWGVCGFSGGSLRTIAHRCVHVPCDDMGMVEAIHGVIFHWLVGAVKAKRQAQKILTDAHPHMVGRCSECSDRKPQGGCTRGAGAWCPEAAR